MMTVCRRSQRGLCRRQGGGGVVLDGHEARSPRRPPEGYRARRVTVTTSASNGRDTAVKRYGGRTVSISVGAIVRHDEMSRRWCGRSLTLTHIVTAMILETVGTTVASRSP